MLLVRMPARAGTGADNAPLGCTNGVRSCDAFSAATNSRAAADFTNRP